MKNKILGIFVCMLLLATTLSAAELNSIQPNDEESIYYKISVNLHDSILFNSGEKYWISIWAIGTAQPYSGWGYHRNPIMLHEAVIKAYYIFNDSKWHNVSEEILLNYSADMCFQLIFEEIPEDTTPPTVEITKPVKGLYFRDKYILPRFIRLTQIIGKITVEVEATDNESGINRVEFYYGPLGGKLFATDTIEPYSALWKRDRLRIVHLHILKVVAYDNANNSAQDSMIVRKIW